MPADQQDCAQRLRGASLQLVTVLLRALHVASLPALPVAADTAASAAANASAAAAGLPLPPLRLPSSGELARRRRARRPLSAPTDAGAGAGAMELSVGAVFTWVLRLWEDELRRGLTVSELRVRQLAHVGLSAQRGPGLDPASRRGALATSGLLYLWSPTDCMMPETPPLSAGYTTISLHF